MHDMLGKLRWDDFIDGIVTSMITHFARWQRGYGP